MTETQSGSLSGRGGRERLEQFRWLFMKQENKQQELSEELVIYLLNLTMSGYAWICWQVTESDWSVL